MNNKKSSAKKSHEKSQILRAKNRSVKSRIHNFLTKARDSILSFEAASNHDLVVSHMRKAESEIMKAARKGVIHKKTASRKISRMVCLFKKISRSNNA